jgi:hypothetical protein
MTKGRSACKVLAWNRNMIDPALHAAVDTLSASILA